MGVSRWYTRCVIATAVIQYARAADIAFMTELQLYSQLAPCAQSAIIYNYNRQTETTACGPDVTQLQSCICSQSATLQDLYSSFKAEVSASCGTVGTDDLASVSQVVSKYCTPDADITFSTPTTNIVNQMVTEVAEFTYLPSCAQSGVSSAVHAHGYEGCPSIDNMYAPCVCNKKGVVGPIQERMSREVRLSCSNGEDVSIAANYFLNYCNMNNGTTSFAPPQGPPGDMTYYITALPQFSSLNSCAQAAVEYAVMGQSNDVCPSGPQAMASCACIKYGVLGHISQTLTSSVKFECGNTANEDISSAAKVLDYYCQAAENKVVASVVESIVETYATGVVPNTSRPTNSGGPAETGGANGADGEEDGSGNKSGGGVSRPAVIAASVLAAVVVIAIIVGIALFIRRKNKRKAASAAGMANAQDGNGHPELHGANKVELPGATSSPVSELGNKTPTPVVMQHYGQQHPYNTPYNQGQQHAELNGNHHLSSHQGSPSELSSPGHAYGQYPVPPSAVTTNQSPHAQQPSHCGQPHTYELDSNRRHQ